MTSDFKQHRFHDAATVASSGNDMNVIGFETVSVHIRRTAGTSTVQFQVTTDGTNYVSINGVNTTTLATATSTTGADQDWEFNVSAKSKLRMNLSAADGGAVTIVGNGVP